MKTKSLSVFTLSTVLILLLALTLGVLFTSQREEYAGGEVSISATDVSFNNFTVSTSTMTEYDANIASTAPSDAVAIGSQGELRDFLNGGAAYGYLTADFTYDKEAMGSNRTFAAGRTLNGNGHTLTLTATANYATSENFGLLVDVNDGILENLKIVYSSSLTVGNAGSVWAQNNVGILTGKNNGIIRNCDLLVTGSFTYNYNNTRIDNVANKNDVFVTAFGGFAGGNSNLITNILLEYRGARITLYTYANYTSTFRIDSKSVFGGAVGTSLDASSECSNVMAVSDSSTSISLTAEKTDGGNDKGVSYREAASVQSNISTRGDLVGKVDNVVVYWLGSYSSLTNGTIVNKNAAVNSGNVTNSTVVDISQGAASDQKGESDANYITLSGCTAKISVKDGVQYVQVAPTSNRLIAMQSFTPYSTLDTVDGRAFEGLPATGVTGIYDQPEKRGGYVLEIPAYQTDKTNYWALAFESYGTAELTFAGDNYTYTGKDYKDGLFLCNSTPVAGNGIKLVDDEGKTVSQLKMPGTYKFSLGAITADVAYVDTENKIMALVGEDKEYTMTIDYADIASIPSETDWLPSFKYIFMINGAESNAADGYVYEVNGSLPKQVDGLVMESDFDTTAAGRTYKVYLTRDGLRVTNPVEFTVKVDANAPVISDVTFDKPVDTYYSKNFVTLKADDYASGVASVTLNGKAMNYDGVNSAYSASLVNGTNTVVATDYAGNKNTYSFDAKIDVVKPVLKGTYYYFDESGTKHTYTTLGFKNNFALYADLGNTVFGNSGGTIYYLYEGEDEWREYTDVLEFRKTCKVMFKAVSNTLDYDTDTVYESISKGYLYFNVALNEIEINADDLVITGLDKTFDGTNEFKGTVKFADGVTFDTAGLTVKAYYSQINAGKNVEITVEITTDKENVVVVNNVSGIVGEIFKKEIAVEVNDAEKTASYKNPVFTYTSNQIAGFEEDIILYTDADEASLPGSYDILLAETEYDNYTVTSFVKGVLTVHKYVIDRMVYDFTTISGLDTSNVKGVVVGFKQFGGGYVDFIVNYEYSATADGTYEACDGMAAAGYYRVLLSLPEEMSASYEIKEGLESFIVKVIDAEIFTPEVESGEDSALEYMEDYANVSTDTDNTTVVKDYQNINSHEYVVMLSVFCLCILVTVFAIGCTRVIADKHRDDRRRK